LAVWRKAGRFHLANPEHWSGDGGCSEAEA
jgi:hypothetical protein